VRPVRLVEFAVVDHIDDGVDAVVSSSEVIVAKRCRRRNRSECGRGDGGNGGESIGGGLAEDSALGTLILIEASSACIFCPPPQWHDRLRPILILVHAWAGILTKMEPVVEQAIQNVLRDTRFTSCCCALTAIADVRIGSMPEVWGGASLGVDTNASPAACRPGWVLSTCGVLSVLCGGRLRKRVDARVAAFPGSQVFLRCDGGADLSDAARGNAARAKQLQATGRL